MPSLRKCYGNRHLSKFCGQKGSKINHRFTCSDKWVVNLLTYKVCEQSNACETIDEFRHRWNYCKDNNRRVLGEMNIKNGFFAHFQSLDHNSFLEDTEITFIGKTVLCNPTKQEDFWIDMLKTHFPVGPNNIDMYD